MEVSFLSDVFDKLFGATYAIYTVENGKERPVLTFDSIIESGIEGKATIISHPVEQGFKATEYKFSEPSIIEMSGIVSQQSLLGQVGDKLLSFVGMDKGDMIEKTRQTLEEYKKNLYIVNIKTRTGVWENYTLQNYHIKENVDNFGLLDVDMTFQEVMLRPSTYSNVKSATQKPTINTGIGEVVKKV